MLSMARGSWLKWESRQLVAEGMGGELRARPAFSTSPPSKSFSA